MTFYLFVWKPITFVILIIAMALWLWRVDVDMKKRGKGGLFKGGNWFG